MKKLLGLFLAGVVSFACAAERPLADTWDFRLDPKNAGEAEGRMRVDFDGPWDTIKTGHWEGQGVVYDGYAWYRQTFRLPEGAAQGGRVTLRFGAVDETAKVWLNGQLLGHWAVGWNAPFEVDATPAVRYGGDNVLVVKVLDEMLAGGIWMPVTLRCAGAAPDAPAAERLRREKARVITAGLGADARAEKLKAHGFNACVNWSYILKDATPGPAHDAVGGAVLPMLEPRIRNEAKLAAKHGFLTLPLVWFHSDTPVFLQRAGYRTCVDFNGRVCQVTPCPTDEGYWQRLMKPLFVKFAEIQRAEGADGGGTFDFEFYTGEFAGYCYDEAGLNGCYCDVCYPAFLDAHADPDGRGLPYDRRAAHVAKRYGREAYLAFLETRVYRQAAEVAAAVRGVKPDFLFAMMPAATNWFMRGAARGFAAPGRPVILLSGLEYFVGYSDRTAALRDDIDARGFPYLMPGGLTMSSFNAEGLGAAMAELADRSDGYWLYYGETLMSASPKLEPDDAGVNEYVLREAPQRHWPAIQRANRWIDARAWLPRTGGLAARPLLSAAWFGGLPEGVAVDGGAVTLPAAAAKAMGINLDFNHPFDQGWTAVYTAPVCGDATMTFDLAGTADGPWNTVSQRLPVTKGAKYAASARVEARGVEKPHLGLVAYNTAAAGAVGQAFLASPAEGAWETLAMRFTAPADAVWLTLQAHGRGGQVRFRDLRVEETRAWRLRSRTWDATALEDATFDADGLDGVSVRVIDPASGLGYFTLAPGHNRLDYLGAVYPEAKAAFELRLDLPASTARVAPKTLSVRLRE